TVGWASASSSSSRTCRTWLAKVLAGSGRSRSGAMSTSPPSSGSKAGERGPTIGVPTRRSACPASRASTTPSAASSTAAGAAPVRAGPPQPLGRVEVPRRDVREVVVQRHRTGRVDDAGALDDPVPQHVLAGGDRVEGGAQRGRVEGAAQALGEGGVPAGGGAVEQRHECARAGCVVRAYRGAQPRIDAVTRTVHVAQAFPSSRGAVPKSERAYDTAQPAGSTRAAVRTAHRGTDLGKLAHEIGYRAGASSPSVITRS